MQNPMFHDATAYDRLVGRYLPTLAPAFADLAVVGEGQRVLDVGCGPGGLTSVLASRVGADAVTAIDPAPPFVAACRQRVPGATVVLGVAESLPFDDDGYDVALASLVVGFMSDPVRGVSEMLRVTRPGGTVALCFWDLDRMPSFGAYWEAVGQVAAEKRTDAAMTGRAEGDLARVLTSAGADDVVSTELEASATYADADDFWSGFAEGIGPAGQHLLGLDLEQQSAVRVAALDLLGCPEGPFTLTAVAWAATGRVPEA